MNLKFWLPFCFIIFFSFLLRLYPTQDNNFYFTMDQANDAIHAREIFERGELVLKGSLTGISGLHAGPGWYYFISIGYMLFNNHPFGALFMVILLSVSLTAFLMWYVAHKVSPTAGLVLGAALQVNWFFYDTSRWAFNPFPTVALSVALIFLLERFLKGSKKAFSLALLPIVLCFNTEVATAAAFYVFYALFGTWAFWKKKVSFTRYALSVFLLPLLGIAGLIVQFFRKVHEVRLSVGELHLGDGVFGGLNIGKMISVFSDLLSRGIFPENILLSFVVLGIVLWLFHKQKKNVFVERLVYLSSTLYIVCFLFFSSNRGWQDWHTYFLPPLIFIVFILVTLTLKNKKIGYLLLAISLAGQAFVFVPRYNEYLKPIPDFSILHNRLEVIDWMYERREGEGFNVYTYEPQIYDYANQYLLWWYGPEKYGQEPCEYSISPGFVRWYIPGAVHYDKPGIGCDNYRFLVIEPIKDKTDFDKWYQTVTQGTELVEKTEMHGVIVEKRRVTKS